MIRQRPADGNVSKDGKVVRRHSRGPKVPNAEPSNEAAEGIVDEDHLSQFNLSLVGNKEAASD
jgi:hypothetical protein